MIERSHRSECPSLTVLIVGAFCGQRPMTRLRATGCELSELMTALDVHVRTMPNNLLGEHHLTLGVDVQISALSDFGIDSIIRQTPLIAQAQTLIDRCAQGSDAVAVGPGDLSLSKLTALLARDDARPNRLIQNFPADDSLDRLLSLVDIPEKQPETLPEEAGPLVSARRLLARQLGMITTAEEWRVCEAHWRSLDRLLSMFGCGTHITLELLDIGEEHHSISAADLTIEQTGEADLIVAMGAIDATARGLGRLKQWAEVAAHVDTPVLISLADDFFGSHDGEVGLMDAPEVLLGQPRFAVWNSLRAQPAANMLFAVWNEVLLRPQTGEMPALWGEPAPLVAGLIAGSIALTGWPLQLKAGPQVKNGVLEEAALFELRRPVAAAAAASLASAGVSVLQARDGSLWLDVCPSVSGAPRAGERAARPDLGGHLLIRMLSRFIEREVLPTLGELPAHEAAETARFMIGTLMGDLIETLNVTETNSRTLGVSLCFAPAAVSGAALDIDFAF